MTRSAKRGCIASIPAQIIEAASILVSRDEDAAACHPSGDDGPIGEYFTDRRPDTEAARQLRIAYVIAIILELGGESLDMTVIVNVVVQVFTPPLGAAMMPI